MNQDQSQSDYQTSQSSTPQQIASLPTVDSESTNKQPIVNNKNSKKVLAIILSSLAGLVIIALVLWYFLWWQNPDRMVAHAVNSVLTAEKFKTSGNATIKSGDQTFTASLGSSYGGGPTGFSTSIRLDADNPSAGTVDLNAVVDPKGPAYIKTNNLSAGFGFVVDAIMDKSASQLGEQYTEEELEAQKAFGVGMIQAMYGPIIKEIDGKWLKISPDDTATGTPESQCLLKTVQSLQTNKEWTNEIQKIYNDNSFLIVKKEVAAKNGSRGFQLDIDSPEVEKKANQFGEAFKKTNFGKALIKCDPEVFDSAEESSVEQEKDKDSATGSLTVWVDRFSHKLTRIEIKDVDTDGKQQLSISLDFMLGEADKVEIPTDSRDIKEVLNNANPFLNSGGSTQLESDTTQNMYVPNGV